MTASAVAAAAPLWRRLIGFNFLTRPRPRRRRLVRRLVRLARHSRTSIAYFADTD